MNSEELELSLRTEFENYLKAVVAEMRQETTEFQSKIEAEFERHKSQFDEAIKAFSSRLETGHSLDAGFTGLVAEHLRLARDEGARIAATAMAEAEKLEENSAVEAPSPIEAPAYDKLRDAINDISTKNSQSSILKSLVQHASEFAPRGAFFIIKNDHFVGWKVFGTDDETVEAAVKEIHFPTSSDSILSMAVRSLATTEGTADAFSDDVKFLEPLNYGQPAQMYAIPLMARGRGVAVLYADRGIDGSSPNLEALEMMVRVAGLTVELLASAHGAKTDSTSAVAADFENTPYEAESPFERAAEPSFEVSEVQPTTVEPAGFAFSESVSFEGGFPQEETKQDFGAAPEFHVEPVTDSPFNNVKTEEPQIEEAQEVSFEYQSFETVQPAFEAEPVSETRSAFESNFEPEPSVQFEAREAEPAAFGSSPFESAVQDYAPAGVPSGGFEPSVEPIIEAPAPAIPKARLSDRPVDLPIEVPEEERRSHNDARRFARLLVSEIKLYNEKKVIEGREGNDLYERLREAIDRSREMYDKRVQPAVADKFDYFHYELVNSLADGDAGRLGSGYPGASV